MFKRIKNLLDISKYTVEELQGNKTVIVTPTNNTISWEGKFNPATIVGLKGTNPFDEYETAEQSPNDTTPRD